MQPPVVIGLVTMSVAKKHAPNSNPPVSRWNSGGRVLAGVAQGDTLSEARQRAHNEIKKIQFNGMQRRPDIGFASFV